ncbi:MAG: dTMP kinase [Candidatus Altiarchaeales archaeon]|nr:dTMP kinase [Candidatus Altiarchaeales archaeon]
MFIVFEGIDGCGKSTQAKLLADWLQAQGKRVLLTAEPTKGRIGLFLREILAGKTIVDPRTLALLFTADRYEHLAREIEPALKRNTIVVSERYYHSTICYQAAQGVSWNWLVDLNKFARKPDYTFLLDVPPKQSVRRKTAVEIFEEEKFLEKVRDNYLKLNRNVIKVDGSKRPEKVFEEIKGRVKLK